MNQLINCNAFNGQIADPKIPMEFVKLISVKKAILRHIEEKPYWDYIHLMGSDMKEYIVTKSLLGDIQLSKINLQGEEAFFVCGNKWDFKKKLDEITAKEERSVRLYNKRIVTRIEEMKKIVRENNNLKILLNAVQSKEYYRCEVYNLYSEEEKEECIKTLKNKIALVNWEEIGEFERVIKLVNGELFGEDY